MVVSHYADFSISASVLKSSIPILLVSVLRRLRGKEEARVWSWRSCRPGQWAKRH